MTFQLLLLFLFCVTAGVTDVKTGKVRNKDILLFLGLGGAYFGLLLYFAITQNNPYLMEFLRITGINFLVAFGVSFVMRMSRIWPAGDAKTYALCTLLIPLSCYKHVYFTYFPGFTLVLNIFIAGFVYIMAVSLAGIVRGYAAMFRESTPAQLRDRFSDLVSARWKQAARTVSSYFLIFLVMNLVYAYIDRNLRSILHIRPELFVIIMFFIIKPVGTVINKYLNTINHVLFFISYYVVVLYVCGWSFQAAHALLWAIILNAFKFMAFYGVIRGLAEYYVPTTRIPLEVPELLHEGDMLTKESMDSMSADARAALYNPPEGLTQEDIECITADFYATATPQVSIEIFKPMPFVPVIAAGVIFTVLFGISPAPYLRYLIAY